MNVKLKVNEFEAVQYFETEAVLSGIKVLCEEKCIITFEHAYGIGCYWLVKVDVGKGSSENWEVLPIGAWVIKDQDGNFSIESDSQFRSRFVTLDDHALNQDNIASDWKPDNYNEYEFKGHI